MARDEFIQQFVAAFLASRAAIRYDNGGDWKWVYDQPVEDAKYMAEQAWHQVSQKLLATPSSPVTIGAVATATTETASIPTTSSSPGPEVQTPSTIS